MDYKLRWSEESIRNLEEILDYLKNKWTDKEVNNFKKKLSHQIDLIIQNPLMFPSSIYRSNLRKAILSKQTTIFYEIMDNVIFLSYIHVNKKDMVRIK